MRYSVIVLTFGDRLEALQRCLMKITRGAQARPGVDYEIIVVNNGSEASLEWFMMRAAPLPREQGWFQMVYRPENEGVCARNYGIDIARGDIIIQVDDDVLVTPGFDNVLLEPYSRPEVGATGPHGFYQDSTWGLLIDDRRRPQPGQYADLLMGYCWSWRHKGDINIWDKPFRYDWAFSPFWHEESDLQCQIRAAGHRLMVTRPVATHQTRHDWKETMADGPQTGLRIATDNFFKLKDKWGNQESDLPFEGPAVGLRGPAPGGPARRPR